jgi:uncharacterized protein with HEPN domain
MPSRRDQDWLLDILEEADLISTAIAGRSQAEFQSDPILQRAILHMLQTIGEASGQLSPEAIARIPDVPWPQIRGMRNRIVHGYFGLDMAAVWLTATTDVAHLADRVRASGLT